jgi:hypothetical protein
VLVVFNTFIAHLLLYRTKRIIQDHDNFADALVKATNFQTQKLTALNYDVHSALDAMLVACSYDDEHRSRKLGPELIHYKADIENATAKALKNNPELIRQWEYVVFNDDELNSIKVIVASVHVIEAAFSIPFFAGELVAKMHKAWSAVVDEGVLHHRAKRQIRTDPWESLSLTRTSLSVIQIAGELPLSCWDTDTVSTVFKEGTEKTIARPFARFPNVHSLVPVLSHTATPYPGLRAIVPDTNTAIHGLGL